MNKIMVLKAGADAIHKLGNISREDDEYINVKREDENYYYGMFLEGYGFYDVKFNKKDCRPINKEEFMERNGMVMQMNKLYSRILIDEDGNIISDKTFNGMVSDVVDNFGNNKSSPVRGFEVKIPSPIFVGRTLIMDGEFYLFRTSTVKGVDRIPKGIKVKTLNSVYYIENIENAEDIEIIE